MQRKGQGINARLPIVLSVTPEYTSRKINAVTFAISSLVKPNYRSNDNARGLTYDIEASLIRSKD